VYPGSHRLGPLAPSPSGNHELGWLQKIEVGAAHAVPLLPISPGDVVVFSDTTAHESMLNRSERIRLNVEVRFFGLRAHTTKHYLDLQSGDVVNPAPTNQRG
jgi:ectoine hydroxylase-related dioxygenase (phytanoyl-CoA dioxygenase family)